MKVSGFWLMYFAVWTVFMFFTISGFITGSKTHEMTRHGDGSTVIAISRKLKETSHRPNVKDNKRGSDNMNLEDYHPIDPVPSSKASVKPGPIQHGAPIIPYIPQPSPPDPPIPTRSGSG